MSTTITQTMRFRQAVIEYSSKYGVTKAAIRYKTNRQYIYRWRKRYDGTLKSLADKSHRPHHHPNEHTQAELKLISDMRRRNPNAGLVVFWVKLMQRGYTRSITGLYRVLRRTGEIAVKAPNPKYIPRPYEQMTYPGQRVQIDVKFVPSVCLVGDAKGEKYYVDLKAINALFLQRAGVTAIEISTDCTKCQCHRFWSHRVTGTHRGSQGAIIVCKEG